MKTEAPAVTKLYDIMLWSFERVEKYPRDCKFTLGDRIVNNLLQSLDHLITAAYTRDKLSSLRAVNLELEKLRFLMRLSKDRKAISIRQYEFISTELDTLGKMIGGWIKAKSGENV